MANNDSGLWFVAAAAVVGFVALKGRLPDLSSLTDFELPSIATPQTTVETATQQNEPSTVTQQEQAPEPPTDGSGSGGDSGGAAASAVEKVQAAQEEFGTKVSEAAAVSEDVAETVREAEAQSDDVHVGGVQTTTGQNVTQETKDIFGSV